MAEKGGDKWLVITRTTGESVFIGDDITVTISRIKGKSIRLAVKAPADLPIRRSDPVKQEEVDDGDGLD